MTTPVPNPTAVVERATRAAYARKVTEADNNWPPFDEAPMAWRQRTQAEVLAVAADLLDAEAIARSVADNLHGQDVHALVMRRPGESHRDQAERLGAWVAGVIDAAIRGDDSGEADPGLLVILLGAVLAVLAGPAAFAIATGLLG